MVDGVDVAQKHVKVRSSPFGLDLGSSSSPTMLVGYYYTMTKTQKRKCVVPKLRGLNLLALNPHPVTKMTAHWIKGGMREKLLLQLKHPLQQACRVQASQKRMRALVIVGSSQKKSTKTNDT
jgi:hypothetical protein